MKVAKNEGSTNTNNRQVLPTLQSGRRENKIPTEDGFRILFYRGDWTTLEPILPATGGNSTTYWYDQKATVKMVIEEANRKQTWPDKFRTLSNRYLI